MSRGPSTAYLWLKLRIEWDGVIMLARLSRVRSALFGNYAQVGCFFSAFGYQWQANLLRISYSPPVYVYQEEKD